MCVCFLRSILIYLILCIFKIQCLFTLSLDKKMFVWFSFLLIFSLYFFLFFILNIFIAFFLFFFHRFRCKTKILGIGNSLSTYGSYSIGWLCHIVATIRLYIAIWMHDFVLVSCKYFISFLGFDDAAVSMHTHVIVPQVYVPESL